MFLKSIVGTKMARNHKSVKGIDNLIDQRWQNSLLHIGWAAIISLKVSDKDRNFWGTKISTDYTFAIRNEAVRYGRCLLEKCSLSSNDGHVRGTHRFPVPGQMHWAVHFQQHICGFLFPELAKCLLLIGQMKLQKFPWRAF